MQETPSPITPRANRFAKAIAITLLIVAITLIIGYLYDCIGNETFPKRYDIYIKKYAKMYGVPESVVYAVIKTESDFDMYAVSSSDPPAKGLMQITEETFKWVGGHLLKENVNTLKIFDPETNIRYGTYLLSYLYGRFENWNTVYAAYNAGMTRVNGWLKDPAYSDGNGNLTYIPFKETRAYVTKVAEYRIKYENQINNKNN